MTTQLSVTYKRKDKDQFVAKNAFVSPKCHVHFDQYERITVHSIFSPDLNYRRRTVTGPGK